MSAARCVGEQGKKGAKEKKGKKGKAAKVKLTPEEENAVVAICGCLRHLTTLSDTNKARIVKYGAVPPLVQLYQQSTRNKVVVCPPARPPCLCSQAVMRATPPRALVSPVSGADAVSAMLWGTRG